MLLMLSFFPLLIFFFYCLSEIYKHVVPKQLQDSDTNQNGVSDNTKTITVEIGGNPKKKKKSDCRC